MRLYFRHRSPHPVPVHQFWVSVQWREYPFRVWSWDLNPEIVRRGGIGHLNPEPAGGIRNLRLCKGYHRLLSRARTTRILEGEVSLSEAKRVKNGSPLGMSSDATTSMEKDTVEVVSDNSVVTRFDESLTSALKWTLPSGLVITTGKVREVVGRPVQELCLCLG